MAQLARRIVAVCVALAAAAAASGAPRAWAAASAPLDPYPVSAPSALGNSTPPGYVDEDETVRARVDASGRVISMVDDALLKIRGSGDYVIQLPANVTHINDLGGDSVPGLQDGHVSFLGHVIGAQTLGVEATLDMAQVSTLPLALTIAYTSSGHPVPASDIPHVTAPITVTLTMHNRTAKAHAFVRGSAAVAPLAQVLEALRRAPGMYIPEVNLGDQLPVPGTLPVPGPSILETHDTMVPLTLTVTVRLPSGVAASDLTAGADVTTDARGTRLAWVTHLPAGTESPGVDSLSFTFAGPHPRLPAIDVRADPLPLPAGIFAPPGGGTWIDYLGPRADRSAETMLAQEGMASLHRIGDLAQPLGRPGPGPVKVKYDFLLDSGSAPPSRPAGPPPVHGQPIVILLVVAAGAAAVLYAARAWARN